MSPTDFFASNHNPDVLSCLANLSNDEVFTPPQIVNHMLDLLPPEIFQDPHCKFLDPACKTGIFLREIAKRLITGLEKEIPDLQTRVDHILQHQLFGLAITELTSLLTRRSLYCSKAPDSQFSVSRFQNSEGNIYFRKIKHTWRNGQCLYCGASQSQYDRSSDLETHAYEWIHTHKPEEIFNMKFDVIIGNPPYQLDIGNEGGNKSKARAIYHLFIEQAMKLNPNYISMIVPSRWMTRTTEGIPNEWIDKMIKSKKIKEIHDFENSSHIFPGVEIKGGVNYFLWNKDYSGPVKYNYYSVNNKHSFRDGYLDQYETNVIIRDPASYKIIEKIIQKEGNYFQTKSFKKLVSPKDFFTNKQLLTSSWKSYQTKKDETYNIKYYISKSFNQTPFGWISLKQIPKNHKTIPLHKVYIPAAGGSGSDTQVLGRPFYGEPNSVCSQTYLVIGYDAKRHNFSKIKCQNIISYITTKFFRYLVSIKKKTQNGPRDVYQFVPLQDFSQPWTDEKLYQKYGLTQEEIDFIENMIRPMPVTTESSDEK